jgi:hypothetical protein
MKKKFVLTGTDNDGFRHRYSAKKIEEFKEAFMKFMINLEFEENKIRSYFVGYILDKDGNEINVPLKIEEIEDVCWNFNNLKYDVDVFFGKFKIILVIRTQERISMVEHLENEANWIKPLEIKRIVVKKNKVIIPLQKIRNIR